MTTLMRCKKIIQNKYCFILDDFFLKMTARNSAAFDEIIDHAKVDNAI
jgi:hypothetical protein